MPNNEASSRAAGMVPDRDDLASRGTRRGAVSSRATYREGRQAAAPRSGGSGATFLLAVLSIGLLLTAGGGYYFYTQNLAMKEELSQASGRLQSLENRLSAVGESSEETTLKMNEKINLNFSEIDKLWAARRNMLPDIETNQVAVAALKESNTAMEAAMQNQAGRVNALANQQQATDNRLEVITGNIANLDRFSQQLTGLNQDITRLKASVEALSGLQSRLVVTEQDIESINVHRLQVNQSLSTLQEQVRNLQNRSYQP